MSATTKPITRRSGSFWRGSVKRHRAACLSGLSSDIMRQGIFYNSHTLKQRFQQFLEVSRCCQAPFELTGESYK